MEWIKNGLEWIERIKNGMEINNKWKEWNEQRMESVI